MDRQKSDGFLLGVGLAGFVFFTIGVHIGSPKIVQRQAIERGYALYCPQDGEFAWVGECEEEE